MSRQNQSETCNGISSFADNANAQNTPAPVGIRYYLRRDLPELLAIEEAGALHPWSEEEFLTASRTPGVIGLVAEHAHTDRVLGLLIYRIEICKVEVLRLIVHPLYRRQGIAWQMMRRLKKKLSSHEREMMTFRVNERDLSLQLFLRESGFLAVGMDQAVNEAAEAQGDFYLFEFRV